VTGSRENVKQPGSSNKMAGLGMDLDQPSWALPAKAKAAHQEEGLATSPSKKNKTGANQSTGRHHREGEAAASSTTQAVGLKETQSIMQLLFKMSLQGAQQIRDLAGCVWLTFLVKANLPCMVLMQEAGAQYAAAVKDKAGNHKLGPPHIHKWAALLASLPQEETLQEEEELQQQLKAAQKVLSKQSQEETCCSVRFLKGKLAYNKGGDKESQLIKLQLSLMPHPVADSNLENILFKALSKIGTYKPGAAPPAGMERAAQAILQKHWAAGGSSSSSH
jgi:hypothetical protein